MFIKRLFGKRDNPNPERELKRVLKEGQAAKERNRQRREKQRNGQA